MLADRRRPMLYAALALTIVWLLAMIGFLAAGHSKATADKVAQYLRTEDLSRLSADARARALRDLARQLNALSLEERRRARLDGEWERWFGQMTEAEKSAFIEATLPSGFKQMIASFEQLPDDKRQRAIEEAIRQLKRAQEGLEREAPGPLWRERTNRIELSRELQQQVVKIGLKTFYQESSAQTKAELAPLLDEMQRTMERGALFHR